MSTGDMRVLLGSLGQFVLDDFESETDYARVSSRSSRASGQPDLWAQWEGGVRAVAEQVPAAGMPPIHGVHGASVHPAIASLQLLPQLDRQCGMRLIQSATRVLVVPEIHGSVIALTCYVRFISSPDELATNPLGAIGEWSLSRGLLLGLPGAPLQCDGTVQFFQVVWKRVTVVVVVVAAAVVIVLV